MKRIVLFSDLGNNSNSEKVLDAIIPDVMANKEMLYMPSGGLPLKYPEYYDDWKQYCAKRGCTIDLINNAIPSDQTEKINQEKLKLEKANILVITGGDPFKLLYHLRRTGLDEAIIQFTQKREFVLAGFSAGAMVLTPTISITTMMVSNESGKRVPIYEVRGKSIHPGLNNNLAGLNLVNFEIVPHYEQKFAQDVEVYKKQAKFPVKTCTDEEYYIIDN
jgi:peptidase E